VTVPTDVTCRFCGHRLQVRAGVALAGLSCPVCLGRLAPEEPAVSVPGPSPAPIPIPDADVRADQKRMGCGLIGLAVLGGLGALWWGLVAATEGREPGVLALVAVAILAIIVLPLAGDQPWARVTRRVLVWLFALGGVLILLAVAFVLFVFVSCLVTGGRMFR
jgi:hypothetical protein